MSGSEPSPGPSHSKKRNRIPDPESFLMSPMKKRPNSGGLTANEKMISINIYKHLMRSSSTYPEKGEITKATAQMMGTSEKTIQRIIKEYKIKGEVTSPSRSTPKYSIVDKLDDFTMSAIKRKVHQFFFRNELPTIKKITMAINDDEDLPSFSSSTVSKILKKLKFKYMKRTRKSILLDRPDLMVWRRTYLQKIRDYRKQNRKIYYTDETWLNEGHTSNYVWNDLDIKSSRQAFLNGLSTGLKNPQKGKRLIITHIGSSEGFLEGGQWIFEAKKGDGDYHGEMDAHNFEKWFEKILNKVEPGSVIVLDNAPYHSRLVERVPNMSWRKADIQTWLKGKNISYEEKDIKAQLLTKFEKNNYNKKAIDVMAAHKNVILLRLPPYHCELNPIELIWAQLKSYVGRNNKTFKINELKDLIEEGLSQIGTVSWSKCIEHIKQEEETMMQLEGLLDAASDKPTQSFIIDVGESSEDSDSSESD
ncbi:uncharacterized protein LOC112045306 isoform X2 [Bicyclus anynana]|nr:uncharacterized protein LOC112045306 isoform X2 [Bicyclus anynana]